MDLVVLDTNVVVSALIGKANPRRVLESIFSDKAILCLSTAVLTEYEEVLSRPKFIRYPEFSEAAAETLKHLRSLAHFAEPAQRVNICPDSDDDKYLEIALETGAKYLVTGNKKHFPIRSFSKTLIVSPAEYLRSSESI